MTDEELIAEARKWAGTEGEVFGTEALVRDLANALDRSNYLLNRALAHVSQYHEHATPLCSDCHTLTILRGDV